MNQRNIYIGIVFVALIAIGVVCFVIVKKSSNYPVQNEWLPASALPKHQPAVSDNKWFWIQNNTIYCGENQMGEADVATFVASSISPYGKDKSNVYYCTQVVANFDPATFEVLDGNFGKDATYVVYGGYYLVPGANAPTFSVIPGTSYGKDQYRVWDIWRELPGADPETFEIVPPNAAKDKNAIYISDTRFGPASLSTDNTQYAVALPAQCNPAGADPISPQAFPGAFSEDEKVIGYMSASRICIIDKKAGTVQSFPYGFSDSASLSEDGSKVLFSKYQKGDGEGDQIPACPDCGRYSLDRATGEIQKIP